MSAFVPCVAALSAKAPINVGFAASSVFKALPMTPVAATSVPQCAAVMSADKSFDAAAPRRSFIASAAALAGLLSVPSASFAAFRGESEGKGANFGFFVAEPEGSGKPPVYSFNKEDVQEAVKRIQKARAGLESANKYARKKFWGDMRADIRRVTYDLRRDIKEVATAVGETEKAKIAELSKSLFGSMTDADLAAKNNDASASVSLSEKALDLFDEIFSLIPAEFTS
mmetsp:Transcript_21518/g.36902  ORF Transcript_21518/g.36902 Transcript_21518/m.36902 type:complete len:227 (+) Transcript_21518:126-806(+)|eukprot:CAMPEP_0196662994 /NCGR_PEP_ID=MMETSP1086-20130531/51145_1 /TAXON_ID=77921 /ORGANISM="Cyanoptyche  gloeocystis , Strain SAG4.97" /LENGTH=226 /DNA_ID=CAMNT_0041998641 /DNA_START=117 /DNA_END=797 /DNA_ORIENTATION=+